MRAFTLVLLVALLAVSVSAARLSSVSRSVGVVVPYKWCGKSTDDGSISSVLSNEFPPVKGDTLSLNVTGNLTKEVTSGQYTIAASVGGFPLPPLTGDIDAFRSLPWPVGSLNFTYSQSIPSAAPSGKYDVKISAVDQDKTQIFCISISFTLSAADDEEGQVDAVLRSAADDDNGLLMAARGPFGSRSSAMLSKAQLKRPELKMPKIKPINRRL